MIRIESVHIEEFRGIRDLDLDLKSANFGICGPNGTGKSGVVDAIEFCITGDVTRLSGQGSAGLSVKSHAPHVDQHDHPERANVTITAKIPSLGKTVKIHRSVKNPRDVQISPSDMDVKEIVAELQTHPEFALSRREIVKYIITPPGRRSEDVQTLLRLEHLEKLRKSITTFNNRQKSEADSAERNRRQAEIDLTTALKIDKLDSKFVLEKVNEKRAILGLELISELTEETSFKAGIVVPKDADEKPALRKVTALADVSSLKASVEGQEPTGLSTNSADVQVALKKLKEDDQALTLARRHGFIKTGLDLITDDACPLCDKPWQIDELREHLQKKLLSAEEIETLLQQLRSNINVILQFLSERIAAVNKAIMYSQVISPPIQKDRVEEYLTQLQNAEKSLSEFLNDYGKIDDAVSAADWSWWYPDSDQRKFIDELNAAIDALPDTSVEDEARDFLSVTQDRYEKLLRESNTARIETARKNIAQRVLDKYNSSSTSILEGIYDQVATDFSRFYRVINREDEEKFTGKLTSAPAKLSFDVDFYGRGLFPPGAYHSEGHQDGMGLCLYLALMKHTLADKFTFAVLDDVLMSIDAGHRREVCRLLKTEFPNTQFILTTHDRVWLQYMRTEGLIARSKSFVGWTVDMGPRVWDDHDIWSEIEVELDKTDVTKSAWLLRRYLEYTATILADNLRARVEFRGDGRYDLGDLLSPVLKEWKKRLEDGEKSAAHWKQEEKKKAIAAKRVEAKKLIAITNIEQWAINPSVHFNEWANLEKHEFQVVVDAFKALLETLRCENESCKSYLYVLPRKLKAEELRCNCGATNINLKTGT